MPIKDDHEAENSAMREGSALRLPDAERTGVPRQGERPARHGKR